MNSFNLLFFFYGLFLFAYIIFSLFGIYHLWRFGYSGDLSKVIIILYSVISIVIIMSSVLILTALETGA